MTDSTFSFLTESPLGVCVPFTSSRRSPTQRPGAANGERNESSEASLAATVKTIAKTPGAALRGSLLGSRCSSGESLYVPRHWHCGSALRAHLRKAFQGYGKAFQPMWRHISAQKPAGTESEYEEKGERGHGIT